MGRKKNSTKIAAPVDTAALAAETAAAAAAKAEDAANAAAAAAAEEPSAAAKKNARRRAAKKAAAGGAARDGALLAEDAAQARAFMAEAKKNTAYIKGIEKLAEAKRTKCAKECFAIASKLRAVAGSLKSNQKVPSVAALKAQEASTGEAWEGFADETHRLLALAKEKELNMQLKPLLLQQADAAEAAGQKFQAEAQKTVGAAYAAKRCSTLCGSEVSENAVCILQVDGLTKAVLDGLVAPFALRSRIEAKIGGSIDWPGAGRGGARMEVPAPTTLSVGGSDKNSAVEAVRHLRSLDLSVQTALPHRGSPGERAALEKEHSVVCANRLGNWYVCGSSAAVAAAVAAWQPSDAAGPKVEATLKAAAGIALALRPLLSGVEHETKGRVHIPRPEKDTPATEDVTISVSGRSPETMNAALAEVKKLVASRCLASVALKPDQEKRIKEMGDFSWHRMQWQDLGVQVQWSPTSATLVGAKERVGEAKKQLEALQARCHHEQRTVKLASREALQKIELQKGDIMKTCGISEFRVQMAGLKIILIGEEETLAKGEAQIRELEKALGSSAMVKIHADTVDALLQERGRLISAIQERSGVSVRLDKTKLVVTIGPGSEEAVSKAEAEVEKTDKVARDAIEEKVSLSAGDARAIIGPKGSNVRGIEKKFGVKLKIGDTEVVVRGDAAMVKKAVKMLSGQISERAARKAEEEADAGGEEAEE